MEDNEQTEGQFRRILLLFAAGVGIAAIVSGLIIWAPWSSNGEAESDQPSVRTFELAADDAKSIQHSAENILVETGNFGIEPEQLTNNNLQEIGYTVTRQDPGWDSYVTSRAKSYDSVRDSIMRNSPIDYDRSVTAKWPEGNELATLKTFDLEDSNVTMPEEGTIESSNEDEDARYVRVKATFNSTVTQRLVTAEDTSWDGSYRILQKDFSGAATFVFRNYAGEWLLHDVEEPNNGFLLSLWTPNFTDEYTDKMFDFREVEIVTPDKPYK